MKPRARLLWGVSFTGSTGAKDGLDILSTGWHASSPSSRYTGEPSRTLLFVTRAHARAWCRVKEAYYADQYPAGHLCRKWRFRAVRVRETVVTVK